MGAWAWDMGCCRARLIIRQAWSFQSGQGQGGNNGPGRPKLGVASRQGRRGTFGQARRRQAEEAADRVLQAMTGNYAGYEEASRAFWRNERENLDALIANWPDDVRDYLRQLAAVAWKLRSAASQTAATRAVKKTNK